MCPRYVSSIPSKVVGLPTRLISAFPVVYCDMAVIYRGDLPNDWCLVPVEKIDGYKGAYFQVGWVVLHVLDHTVVILLKKNKETV